SRDDQLERARILHALHRDPEAVAACEAALALRPDDPESYRLKAEALHAQRQENEAAKEMDQYLAMGGKRSDEVYHIQGRAHARQRQFPAALADYTQALAMKPDSSTYAARAWLFLANEGTLLALQDFEEAIRLNPANAEALA